MPRNKWELPDTIFQPYKGTSAKYEGATIAGQSLVRLPIGGQLSFGGVPPFREAPHVDLSAFTPDLTFKPLSLLLLQGDRTSNE